MHHTSGNKSGLYNQTSTISGDIYSQSTRLSSLLSTHCDITNCDITNCDVTQLDDASSQKFSVVFALLSAAGLTIAGIVYTPQYIACIEGYPTVIQSLASNSTGLFFTRYFVQLQNFNDILLYMYVYLILACISIMSDDSRLLSSPKPHTLLFSHH